VNTTNNWLDKEALELLVQRVAEFRIDGGSVEVDLKDIRL